MSLHVVSWLARSRMLRTVVCCFAAAAVCLPLIAAAGVASLAGQADGGCGGEAGGASGGGGGTEQVPAGMFAVPLRLKEGRWYEFGATEYGGPGDPSSADYGSIPDPGQSYLPSHPDSFAELSVLSSNPANSGSFSFGDANALGNLPYLTALRVRDGDREAVLLKRDVGYGQGPGQTISNGEPYRLDLWWQAAQQLGVSKSAVRVELAPRSGTGNVLGQTEASASGGGERSPGCGMAGEATAGALLPLTPGLRTQILPDGLAAAGSEAPAAVKVMVAAGNRLYGTSYLYGGGHGVSLSQLQSAYDCSSAVSYVLYAAGVLGGEYAEDSTQLESYGLPGPGKYVSIYANAEHAFIYVAGLRFDTVEAAEYDSGPNSGKPGPKWRVYPGVPGWSTWVVRHPPGL